MESINQSTAAAAAEEETSKPTIRIFAWDYSGSTANMQHYHTTGRIHLGKCLAESASSNKIPTRFLTWDTYCTEVTVESLQVIIDRREGRGGTDPSAVVQWIIDNVPVEAKIHLILVTDGEIGRHELQRCSLLNEKVSYHAVDFVVINTRPINMSVGASFFRGSKVNVFKDADLYKTVNTSKPFDYQSINIENFTEKWDSLSEFIEAKFMGSEWQSLEEVKMLTNLKQRLFQEIAAAAEAAPKEIIPLWSIKKTENLLEDLKTCEFFKLMTSSNTHDQRGMIDASISTLINYIHNKNKSYHFESIKVDFRMNQIPQNGYDHEEPELDLTDLEDCQKVSIYDAVTLEEEPTVPVLLLEVHDLIDKYWIQKNYSKFRTITDCPFFAEVDGCIGHVFSFETFKSLMENPTTYNYDGRGVLVNPMTNNKVEGGLIFLEKADKYNDFVLTMTLFRGKKVRTSLPLWYYMIWKSAETKAWIDADVKKLLREYALRRMASAKVKLTFSSLPLEPNELVPVPVAAFYCTEGSSRLFGQNSALHINEKLRMFWPVVDIMLDILDTFEYSDIDKEFIRDRASTFKIMTNLKHIPNILDKKYFLLSKIFESVGPFLVGKIKDLSAKKYLHLLNFDHKKSVIPFDLNLSDIDKALNSFLLLSYECSDPEDEMVNICPQTFRPFFTIQKGNDFVSNYEEILNSVKEVSLNKGEFGMENPKQLEQRKLISLYKLFIDVTNHLKKFPTLDEFMDYVHKAKKFCDDRVRIFPLKIVNYVQDVYDKYQGMGLGTEVSLEDFIKKSQGSTKAVERVKMENILEDKTIDDFVNKSKGLIYIVPLEQQISTY